MATTTEKRWLSKQDAADYIGASLATLRRLTEQGKLHPSRLTDAINRSPIRYDRLELDAFMESRAEGKPLEAG